VHTLVELFASILLVIIVVAGIIMMFNSKLGWQILKNAGVSLALFVLGTMLMQSFCSSERPNVRAGIHVQ
jgi:low affinity Fe/Cu permease